jgi:hypothetical protein
MRLRELLQGLLYPQADRVPTPGRRRPQLGVEQLEDRLVLYSYTASSVTQLIADINAANRQGGSNTITLVAGTTFTLTAVNNTTDGATGLPVIAAQDNLTIQGNGDTITRSTVSGTPDFRLLDVGRRAALTLESLTLQGGLAYGFGVSAEGGGIYNQGTLDLNGVTLQNNTAQGGVGVLFGRSGFFTPGPGGNGYGGGIYVAAGSVTLSDDTLSANAALGGQGCPLSFRGHSGNGGNCFGGALYVAGGTMTLRDDAVTGNTANGGAPGQSYNATSGLGEGGGIYIATPATVSLDGFTVANVLNNTASTSDPNIDGSYQFLS